MTTIRHLASSPHLTQVKASSETQDVQTMDMLLKVVRKSFARSIGVGVVLTLLAGARSNPAYHEYGL